LERKRLLIVDDEKNIRLTLARALEIENLEVETAAYAEEALFKLGQGEYALLLVDIELPGMDGMTLLQQIRQKHPSTPVMIITAYGSAESIAEAMKLGAVDYVQKPFSPKEIRQRVLKALPTSRPS